MPVKRNSQAGFTLVELLVAVVILSVGLLGLAQLQVSAIRTNAQSASSTAATALAQRIVEEVAAMSSEDPMFDGPGGGTWPGSPISVAGAGTYNITYNVAQVTAAGTPVTNVFQVSITVTSSTDVMHVLGNRVRSVTATTLKRAI